jgi:Fur family transcriptional regulator, peroxide stress response regulator
MTDFPDRPDRSQIAESLSRAGLRPTPQRLAICRALASAALDHPTAREIHQRLRPAMPSLSLATVYNTLQVLVEAGWLHSLGESGAGPVRYDADPRPHANLICSSCGRINDDHDPLFTRAIQRAAQRAGYRIQGAWLTYHGICPSCQQTDD